MKQQRGISLIGLLLLLALFAVCLFLAVRIGPIYVESYKIDAIMKSVANEMGRSKFEMKESMMRRFEIDDIDRFTEKDIRISKRNGRSSIRMYYSVRRNIIGNVDVIVSFDKHVKTKG